MNRIGIWRKAVHRPWYPCILITDGSLNGRTDGRAVAMVYVRVFFFLGAISFALFGALINYKSVWQDSTSTLSGTAKWCWEFRRALENQFLCPAAPSLLYMMSWTNWRLSIRYPADVSGGIDDWRHWPSSRRTWRPKIPSDIKAVRYSTDDWQRQPISKETWTSKTRSNIKSIRYWQAVDSANQIQNRPEGQKAHSNNIFIHFW